MVQTTRDSLHPFAERVYVNQLGDTSEPLSLWEVYAEGFDHAVFPMGLRHGPESRPLPAT